MYFAPLTIIYCILINVLMFCFQQKYIDAYNKENEQYKVLLSKFK